MQSVDDEEAVVEIAQLVTIMVEPFDQNFGFVELARAPFEPDDAARIGGFTLFGPAVAEGEDLLLDADDTEKAAARPSRHSSRLTK